jgi:multimeric flavodoxin WrbA
LVEGLTAGGVDEVSVLHANELQIKPCQGCFYCRDSEGHACIRQDDMREVAKEMIQADFVVFASPVYWGYVTAQLKTIIDRMEAFAWDTERYFKGKRVIVLLTYRFPSKEVLDSLHFLFRDMENWAGTKLTSFLEYNSFDPASGRDVHVDTNPDKLEEAFRLGKVIAGS